MFWSVVVIFSLVFNSLTIVKDTLSTHTYIRQHAEKIPVNLLTYCRLLVWGTYSTVLSWCLRRSSKTIYNISENPLLHRYYNRHSRTPEYKENKRYTMLLHSKIRHCGVPLHLSRKRSFWRSCPWNMWNRSIR